MAEYKTLKLYRKKHNAEFVSLPNRKHVFITKTTTTIDFLRARFTKAYGQTAC